MTPDSAVGSRKYAQAPGAPGKSVRARLTKVSATFQNIPGTPRACTSFSRSTTCSRMTKVIVILTSMLLAGLACAQSPLSIDVNEEVSLNLGSQLEYLEDQNGQLTLAEALQMDDNAWTRNLSKIPNFGYTDSTYWFRFRLINHRPYTQNKLIAIQYALLDHIEFFRFERGELVDDIRTGDIYPFAQRPIRHRDFLFPFALQFDEPVDVYLKIKTEGSTQLPITLWDAQQFSFDDQDEQLIKALYYGMMLVMVIYNLFLFVSIRERSYLYYVGLVISVLVLMSGAHGFLYQYLYPGSPSLHKMSMLLSVPAVMLFAGLFSSFFLRLNESAPRLNAVLNGFVVLFALCIIGAFVLPYSISTRISVFLAIPASLFIMFAGPYTWIKGQTSARYFTIAWAFLLLGIVVSAASKFGFLPRNGFTEHALNWGSALEVILLSFALADRFNRERSARFTAQKQQLEEAEQRKAAEGRLYYQATHQAVDGFPNLLMLQQVLHNLLHSETDSLKHFSLVFIHLSRIHEINKTLGHANADIVLSLFSNRLSNLKTAPGLSLTIEKTEQTTHYFAHIEGVIFAHILRTGEVNKALQTALEIRRALAEPVEFNGMKLDLGLSVGIAAYPVHGRDIATLIRHARVAIDGADNSNDHVGVYSKQINPYSARRLALMGELRKAIDESSLALYYQPIIQCRTGETVGAEALLRWNHPRLGDVSPDEFVLLAEKTGIMRSLTHWVLDQALATCGAWPKETRQKMISVNISAINLQEKDFGSTVLELLAKHGVAAESLVLEITETAIMKDPNNAMRMLRNLADLGVKLAIDDFGTGHSSLSYIRQLPVYEIKIDRSFVTEMDRTAGDRVIVKTTLNMSRDLGYKVVAEGIENQAVLNALRSMDCDYAQGFHIARPMQVDAINEWMAGDGTAQRKGSAR